MNAMLDARGTGKSSVKFTELPGNGGEDHGYE
jgi:hypothetical protein